MLLRRAHLALLLAAALTVMALSAAVDATDSDISPRGAAADGVSFAIRAAPVGAAIARLTGEERRDVSAERTLKQRIVLAAVLVALLGAAQAAWRGVVVHRRHRRPVTSLWSPQAGRSPPSSLSIA